MYVKKFSNRSSINFIVAYLDNWELHIFITRKQHVHVVSALMLI